MDLPSVHYNHSLRLNYHLTPLEVFHHEPPACTPHPNPTTRTPKLEISNPKPENRKPKSESQNPKPEIRNPKPETRNQAGVARDSQTKPGGHGASAGGSQRAEAFCQAGVGPFPSFVVGKGKRYILMDKKKKIRIRGSRAITFGWIPPCKTQTFVALWVLLPSEKGFASAIATREDTAPAQEAHNLPKSQPAKQGWGPSLSPLLETGSVTLF